MAIFPRGKKGLLTFEFMFHNQPHRMACKTTNRQTAERLEREYRRKLELGQLDLTPIKKKQTLFKDAVVDYVERMQPSWKPSTRTMHKTSLPKVLEFFGDMVLNEIKYENIQRYQVHRQAQETIHGTPPSNRTINTEITLVRQLMIDHKLWHRMKEGTKLRMLRENKNTGKALTKEQIVLLFNACKMSNSRVLYPAVMLSVFTGLRSSELKQLRWNQIDLVNKTLSVGKTKSDAGDRIIPLSAMAINLIEDWKANFAALPEHFVFPSERYAWYGKRGATSPNKSYTSFKRLFKAACVSVGIQCRWHDLRHSYASILGASGASRATIKSLCGWVPDKMLDVYLHSQQQEQQQAAMSLDTYFAGILDQNSQRGTIQ